MELVEGRLLSALIPSGGMPIDSITRYGAQCAGALAHAHERGIIHRDLKPANVRVTSDGKVKILDFGLAKAIEHEASGTTSAASPTVAPLATTAGMMVGTVAYMAPEQARGKGVDKRADIWAFGVLLFEMISGQRPFEGETVSDTLASVLTRDVDLDRLSPSTPDALRTLLSRCLERDVTVRLRDIGEARIALSGAPRAMTATAAPATHDSKRRLGAVMLLAAAIGSLIVGAAGHAVWSTWRAASQEEHAPLTLGIDAGTNTPIAGAYQIRARRAPAKNCGSKPSRSSNFVRSRLALRIRSSRKLRSAPRVRSQVWTIQLGSARSSE